MRAARSLLAEDERIIAADMRQRLTQMVWSAKTLR